MILIATTESSGIMDAVRGAASVAKSKTIQAMHKVAEKLPERMGQSLQSKLPG